LAQAVDIRGIIYRWYVQRALNYRSVPSGENRRDHTLAYCTFLENAPHVEA